MNIKRKLKVNNKSKRKPAEEDESFKEKEVIKHINKNEKEYNIKLQKLEAAKNLKLLQNARLRKKGICVDDDVNYESKLSETDEKEKKSLDKQFTKNISEKEIEDAHVESFIRENMKEFFEEELEEAQEKEQRSKEKKGKLSTNEDILVDDLFKLSDDIRVKNTANGTSEKLNCITGITEIPLPVEMKLKNIEETEKMKRKILKKAKIIKTKHH